MTLLEEAMQAPAHPLDDALNQLAQERFDNYLGKAATWEERTICFMGSIAAKIADEEKLPENWKASSSKKTTFVGLVCAATIEEPAGTMEKLAANLGSWLIGVFRKKDIEAIRRLQECLEHEGFSGLPRIKGTDHKKGRKDLVRARNIVMTKLLEGAKSTGVPFCDGSIRLYAKIYCGINQLSDETVKAWREYAGEAGLRHHIKLKRGPKKGTKQALRASSNYSAKLAPKKASKPGK